MLNKWTDIYTGEGKIYTYIDEDMPVTFSIKTHPLPWKKRVQMIWMLLRHGTFILNYTGGMKDEDN